MKAKWMSILAIVCVLCILIFTLAGCSQLSNKINRLSGGTGVSASLADSPTPAIASPAASDDGYDSLTDPDTIAKQNAYIDLYNELVDNFQSVVSDYAYEFGIEQQIQIPDDFSGYTMLSTSASDFLQTAMGYADEAPARPDADAALKALAPDLTAYCQALSNAKTYYGDKNYVDDQYAQAQSFHDVIIGDYDTVESEIEAFVSAVDTMLEGQDEQQLAYYQQNDMMVHYYALDSLVTAEELAGYFYENDITAANISDINLTDFKPLYDNFVTAYTGFTSLVNSSNEGTIGESEGIYTLAFFSDDLSSLKASISELMDMLNNGTTFDDMDASSSFASMTTGTPENISSCISSLLRDYNSDIVG